jgi:abortive infection Abi-like protein
MANLKSSEKLKLENYLEMKTGYVCDFSNRTFAEFVLENTGVDIYTDKYAGSKATRLRAFWDKEPNYLVAKLLGEMIEYWKLQKANPLYGYQVFNPASYEECKKIVARLKNERPVEDIGALTPNSRDKDFELLAQSIKESIEKDQPEQALDRLHTFVIKYVRELCSRHGIVFDKETPLHSLFGLYVKFLQKNSLVESEMSGRILKSSISVLDAFNDVRNNQSFAHDNPILNKNEAVLIFNDISNTLRFVDSIERRIAEREQAAAKETPKPKEEITWNDIEFSDEEIDAAGDAWIQQQIDIRRGK